MTSTSPDLVCAEQLTTSVRVSGDGFTPLPVDTLTGARLELPRLELLQASPLQGAAEQGPLRVSDEPGTGSVHWASAQEMSFDVSPALALSPGVYDLRVTNPDGVATATAKSALIALARPRLTQADRPALCDAQRAQTLTLTGAGFLTVAGATPTVHIGTRSNADFTSVQAGGCVPLEATSAAGALALCTSLTVVLPSGLLAPGDYPLVVTNPAPAGCETTEPLSLHVEPPPVVTGTVPASICQGGGNVLVAGQGFLPSATVSLTPATAGQPAIATTSELVADGGASIAATFGGGGALSGQYDLVVDNADGCTDATPHQKITVVAGPVAFFADPEVVFNGITTRVTVYVTTLLWPGSNTVEVTLTPHGATTPRTVLTGTPVAGHPNRAQVVIPQGQAPGSYDLTMNDASGCPATLSTALVVTDTTHLALKAVTPPFAFTGSRTDITVQRDAAAAAPNNAPFAATPRLFLNPVGATASDVAIQVQSVAFVSTDTLTAVVPANQPARHYDLIVVNPDGQVGVLPNAFNVQSTPPPVVASVTPTSLLSNASNTLSIAGTNFSAGATASLTCKAGGGATTTRMVMLTAAPTCAAGKCSVSGTVASGLTVGSTCVLRVTNDDGSYFDFSSLGVTDTPGNLSSQLNGTVMTKARRAVVAAAGNATGAARFVYAIGGDSGSTGAATPFSDIERASVDQFGTMGPWAAVERSALNTARSFAGSANVGRYVYVFGGSDGAAPLASTERAMILDPTEVPSLDVSDLVPQSTGLDPGAWLYRVSATFAATNLDNPGGESLPSEELVVRVPAFAGKKIQVLLSWTAPVDSLGAPLPQVTGYNIYRTAVAGGGSGAEVLIAQVTAPTQTWTDDGSAPTTSMQKTLSVGSLGRWALLPSLATARRALASVAAFDPVTPDVFYLYALGGEGAANAVLASYEYLRVAIAPNGHQTVTTWATGAQSLSAGRRQLGAWVADHAVATPIAVGTNYVYVGGGLGTGNNFVRAVESGRVMAGGDLGAFSAQAGFTADLAGYSPSASAGSLFAWGGSGAVPASDGHSAVINGAGPALTAGAWNSVGGINLGTGRYLAGSTVQSAFFFVVGGATTGNGASNTTLLMVW